jgi:DNA invertase Pin-like site-specific DNA recombinase
MSSIKTSQPEQRRSPDTSVPAPRPAVIGLGSAKVQRWHLERLAFVYVRQSSPQQVIEHRESRLRQYALADYAVALGWPRDRVQVIDEDQGQSGRNAENRAGFQRLLAEVAIDHVGIVLGLEMSRLARSDKDWHHLLEVCGIFGTLVADQDGVYNAADPNDRLLLGLKGMISSVELQTMRNRLEKGKLSKASRGELFLDVPVGYVKTANGELALDPDEQVRAVITLIFDKFDELSSVYAVYRYLIENNIRLGIRPHNGPHRGELEWRRACLPTLYKILHHPFFAGTYAYGRFQIDPKRQHEGRSRKARKTMPIEQWKAVLHDHVPAYLTWERFERNQEKLRQNSSRWEATGAPRQGAALLGGLVICGGCGIRMQVRYTGTQPGRYDCVRHLRHGHERQCHGLQAPALDELVAQLLLRALEPAALELSVGAADDIQRERKRLALHWQQQLERARYEAQQAERRYRAVDPENRLVARTLEQQWEQALCAERQRQEEYDRFVQQKPLELTDGEKDRIHSLAINLPALWQSAATSVVDRKEILRCLVERIVVHVQGNTEYVDVTIHWAGGFASQHQIRRPVAEYHQMRDYDRLVERLHELHEAGLTAAEIADRLNQEGFHPTGRRKTFYAMTVRQLLSRWQLTGERYDKVRLAPDEWWLSDLARELSVSYTTLRRWIALRWVHYRRTPQLDYHLIWANTDELDRLRRLRDHGRQYPRIPTPAALTTPKRRQADTNSKNSKAKSSRSHQRKCHSVAS